MRDDYIRQKRGKARYFSVNAFSTQVLNEDTIFTSPTEDGTAFLRGNLRRAKVRLRVVPYQG